MPELDEPRLLITADVAGGTAVVSLRGELDVSVGGALAGRLAEITAEKPDLMVFDLAAVTFIDCAIAAQLAGAARRLPPARKPVLRSACPVVRRLLELTGLDAQCELAP